MSKHFALLLYHCVGICGKITSCGEMWQKMWLQRHCKDFQLMKAKLDKCYQAQHFIKPKLFTLALLGFSADGFEPTVLKPLTSEVAIQKS